MKKLISVMMVGLILCLSGCSVANNKTQQEIYAMNTVMNLSVYGENATKAIQQAVEKINSLDVLFSVTNKSSDIYKVNSSQGETLNINQETADLIMEAYSYGAKSKGALDLTIYPVVKAWGFTTDTYRVPTAAELTSLLKYVDYSAVKIDTDKSQVCIPKHFEIDLGAVAKGYTGNKIIEILKQNGITSALINLGGNVQTLGNRPDGSKWTVGIQNPSSQSYFATLSVGEAAIITSGGYQRNFEQEGNIYHHILNPATGYPANNGIISSTVIAKDGTQGDALSTALYVMGTQQAIDYYKSDKTFDMVLLTDNNTVYVSQGLKDNFTLSSEFKNYTVEYI